MSGAITLEKQQFRREIKARKQLVSAEARAMWSLQIAHSIVQLDAWHQAKTVACYAAMADEVDVTSDDCIFSSDKTIALPVISGNTMNFYACTSDACLLKNRYGILEPDTARSERVDEIDLVIVPGMAFDRQGNRLGRGKGYYDRWLAHFTGAVVGVCFDFQLYPSIPTTAHDCKMNMLVTAKERLFF